jgi:hypothetical protein
MKRRRRRRGNLTYSISQPALSATGDMSRNIGYLGE